MMCNCIAEIDARVKERYGSDAYLETVYAMNTRTFEPLGEKPKPLVIRYPHLKKDGTPSERFMKANIYFCFCPFCGVPYDEPHPDAQQPTPQGESTAASMDYGGPEDPAVKPVPVEDREGP